MRHEIEPALNVFWSVSFLAAFRDFSFDGLTELPPGLLDSLASLKFLYVLSLVTETPFISFLLQSGIFIFFARLSPVRCS